MKSKRMHVFAVAYADRYLQCYSASFMPCHSTTERIEAMDVDLLHLHVLALAAPRFFSHAATLVVARVGARVWFHTDRDGSLSL